MLYKNTYSGSRIKYGYSGDFNMRRKNYITHAGDLVISVIEFPQEKDRVDELAIHKYLTNVVNLNSLGGSSEIFDDPGHEYLDIIDSDITLENFYRYLDKIGFLSGGSGKLVGYLNRRVLALHEIFKYNESNIINDKIVRLVADLMESLYLNNKMSLEDNIFIRSKFNKEDMNYILSLNLTCRDILDLWFKWDWSKIVE